MSAQQEEPGQPRLVGSFVSGAERYQQLRPDHPAASVAFCVPNPGSDVVDIGAGTGKLTRALVAAGHRVKAVEPSADMRQSLARTLPDVPLTTPPPSTRGCRTAASTWPPSPSPGTGPTSALLRPSCSASCARADTPPWCGPCSDDGAPWVERVEAAMHSTERAWQRLPGAKEVAWERPPRGAFGRAERHTVAWSGPITLADLVALVTTRSYYVEATPDEQQALLGRVRDRVEREFPTGREEDQVELPYVTTCLRYQRLP